MSTFHRARAAASRLRRVTRPAGPGLPPTDWCRTDANPTDPELLPSFRLFAVLGAWCEADIVEATVRNAREQGCEQVLLVDNDSHDDTVAVATAAGATLAASFRTEQYDEAERMRIMHEVVEAESQRAAREDGDEHIWWLWLDADELHHGPGGRTVREHLATLDRRFRVVGARFYNHYPDRVPEYIEGRHPIDYLPLCEEVVYPMCTEGHRKHPLQRWDAAGPPITCVAGFHQARCEDVLIEPSEPIFLHHFPFRTEAASRRHLEELCGNGTATGTGRAPKGDLATWHIHKRFRQLDAVYRHDWDEVETMAPVGRSKGVHLLPWSRQVPAVDAEWRRW